MARRQKSLQMDWETNSFRATLSETFSLWRFQKTNHTRAGEPYQRMQLQSRTVTRGLHGNESVMAMVGYENEEKLLQKVARATASAGFHLRVLSRTCLRLTFPSQLEMAPRRARTARTVSNLATLARSWWRKTEDSLTLEKAHSIMIESSENYHNCMMR